MSRQKEIDLFCTGAGLPEEVGHKLLADHFLVVEPDGTLKRFCDSDCLREHYAHLWEQFKERLEQQAQERED